jgi:hypothetical protein
MKKAHFIILILLVLSLYSNGQKRSNYLGFSMTGGYKSNYSFAGIAVQARLIKHIDLDFGGSYSFFNGFGYSGGINLVPLNTKLQPFIGVSYGKSFGINNYDITKGEDKTSYYRISPIDYYYLKTGLILNPEMRDPISDIR